MHMPLFAKILFFVTNLRYLHLHILAMLIFAAISSGSFLSITLSATYTQISPHLSPLSGFIATLSKSFRKSNQENNHQP